MFQMTALLVNDELVYIAKIDLGRSPAMVTDPPEDRHRVSVGVDLDPFRHDFLGLSKICIVPTGETGGCDT